MRKKPINPPSRDSAMLAERNARLASEATPEAATKPPRTVDDAKPAPAPVTEKKAPINVPVLFSERQHVMGICREFTTPDVRVTQSEFMKWALERALLDLNLPHSVDMDADVRALLNAKAGLD